jgi:hypothetical protein
VSKKIRIGHASISEDGTITGTAGDSTGKEVLIVDNYDVTKNGYHVLLRPKSAELAEKSAKACEAACANNKIGYSQSGRTSLYNEAKEVNFDLSKIMTACNTDCSAFMAVCAIAGGAKVSPSVTTRNMAKIRTDIDTFATCGSYEVKTDSIYFSSAEYLKRGDILVKEGSHTIMILGKGSSVPTDTATLLADLTVVKIAVDINNISTSKIEVTAHISKIENGVEKILTDKADLGLYKWTYTLLSPTNLSKPIKSKEIKISDGAIKFSIKNLTPASTYILMISAAEIDNSSASFNSPSNLFITAFEDTQAAAPIKFGTTSVLHKVNKIYIKIKDRFKQAIFYNNI